MKTLILHTNGNRTTVFPLKTDVDEYHCNSTSQTSFAKNTKLIDQNETLGYLSMNYVLRNAIKGDCFAGQLTQAGVVMLRNLGMYFNQRYI